MVHPSVITSPASLRVRCALLTLCILNAYICDILMRARVACFCLVLFVLFTRSLARCCERKTISIPEFERRGNESHESVKYPRRCCRKHKFTQINSNVFFFPDTRTCLNVSKASRRSPSVSSFTCSVCGFPSEMFRPRLLLQIGAGDANVSRCLSRAIKKTRQ